MGQVVQKRAITEADYHLWGYLDAEAISDNGQWVSYRNYYQNTDTLSVRNVKTLKTYHFVQGNNGVFAGKDHYVCATPGTLHILDLKTGKDRQLENCSRFEIAGTSLMVMDRDNTLSIYNLEAKLLHTQKNAREFMISPDKKGVVFTFQDSMGEKVILNKLQPAFSTLEITLTGNDKSFKQLTWSRDSQAVAFIASGSKDSELHYYSLREGNLKTFSSTETVFPKTMNVYAPMNIKLSDDGKRVFFKIRQFKELNVVRKPGEVQVWNAQEKFLYPLLVETEHWTQTPKQGMWEPHTGKFLQITDATKPWGASAGDETFALIFNPHDYEPQNKSEADKDVYIMNLTSGKSKLLLSKHIGGPHNLPTSPGGKYVTYFSKGQWYVYDIARDSHTMASANLSYPLSVESDTEPHETGYGNPGWETGDKSMLIYDEFDIWKVLPNGKDPIRLTNGREQGLKFRILPQTKLQRRSNDSRVVTNGEFDLNSDLLLSARSPDNYTTGFYLWNAKKGITKICQGNKKISGIMRSENGIFAWVEEDVSNPRKIVMGTIGGKPKVVVNSNTHYEKFAKTKVEVIHYKNSNGKPLKGLLYYPAGYDQSKKYPLVVNIYEKQSGQVHYYRSPGMVNADGFNVANLTANGYFVLLTDNIFEIGNVGLSAVDCVESAVRAVMSKSVIDDKKIGLIGHSFGGFQTNFIITHSKLFACAIAGAGTSDFLSSHLSMNKNLEIPNFFIVETAQARMMASPFENMDIYLKNSPVMHAANVSTPLLSWTGEQDSQVSPSQSMEFFMALRRLGKPHIMLVYPGEGHELQAKESATDLTRKIGDWLDYYLKGSLKPSWIDKN